MMLSNKDSHYKASVVPVFQDAIFHLFITIPQRSPTYVQPFLYCNTGNKYGRLESEDITQKTGIRTITNGGPPYIRGIVLASQSTKDSPQV